MPIEYFSAQDYDDYVEVAEKMNYGNLNRMRCMVVDASEKAVYKFYMGGGTHEGDNAMAVRGYGEGLFSCRNEKLSLLSLHTAHSSKTAYQALAGNIEVTGKPCLANFAVHILGIMDGAGWSCHALTQFC